MKYEITIMKAQHKNFFVISLHLYVQGNARIVINSDFHGLSSKNHQSSRNCLLVNSSLCTSKSVSFIESRPIKLNPPG